MRSQACWQERVIGGLLWELSCIPQNTISGPKAEVKFLVVHYLELLLIQYVDVIQSCMFISFTSG